jgi:hypoxanthine-DNA glycosylase
MTDLPDIEVHPWEPFITENAQILILGAFPPGEHRWSMEFYYPNPQNDFWRIMGIIFFGDKNYFVVPGTKTFDVIMIKDFLRSKGIAMHDAAYKVRRLKGNASDKFLEVIEPTNINVLLQKMSNCSVIATTGEKAATVLAQITNTVIPKVGESVQTVINGKTIAIFRMPSSSRAYPLAIEKKAAFYKAFFEATNLI